MKYHSVEHAVTCAMQVEGYEAPIKSVDLGALENGLFDHGNRVPSGLTAGEWLAQSGIAHRVIIGALGRQSPHYLALTVCYCYEPVRRHAAMHALSQVVPQRMDKKAKRLAVIAIWCNYTKVTYKQIDCGDGTPNSTLQGHINEIRRALNKWRDEALTLSTDALMRADLLPT